MQIIPRCWLTHTHHPSAIPSWQAYWYAPPEQAVMALPQSGEARAESTLALLLSPACCRTWQGRHWACDRRRWSRCVWDLCPHPAASAPHCPDGQPPRGGAWWSCGRREGRVGTQGPQWCTQGRSGRQSGRRRWRWRWRRERLGECRGGGGVKVSGQPKDGRNGTFSSVLVVDISTLQPIH